MISRAVSVLVFFVALLGTGAWLAEIRPLATVPMAAEKSTWLAAHSGDYDTLFIGSSRIYRGLKPAVFDALTAAAGVPTHSFNFGIDGMAPPEDSYLCAQLLAHPPQQLRWVFIETNTVRAEFGSDDGESARNIHWHDSAHTWIALRALLTPTDRRLRWRKVLFGDATDRARLNDACFHLRLWTLRTLNAGRGGLLFKSLTQFSALHPDLDPVLGRDRTGYVLAGDGRPLSAEDRAAYERRFEERRLKPSHVSILDRDGQHSLDLMLARIHELGARAVLVVPPYLSEGRQHPQPGCAAPMLDYGEVARWPALFQIENRADRSHLNDAGADLFTRLVAADFIELARSRP